jgi:hypothetical protein
MNNNRMIHLKNNLINTVQGKCNNIGYIVKVYKISNYRKGVLLAENFSGNAIYDLKYIANVCKPILKTQIIVKINMPSTDNIINVKIIKAIKAINGPINCVILTNLMDIDSFTINPDGTITCNSNNAILQNNDYVKITIQTLNINSNMDSIVILGYMNDIATEKEVELYFKVPTMTSNEAEIEESSNQIQIFE